MLSDYIQIEFRRGVTMVGLIELSVDSFVDIADDGDLLDILDYYADCSWHVRWAEGAAGQWFGLYVY